MVHYKTPLLLTTLAALALGTKVSYADDRCLTFFWTGSRRAVVDRYKPSYVIGEGLEDVAMADIPGTRIRYQWSTQAATCIGAASSYGYFYHPSFQQTACSATESCFPGTRPRRMSERLADVLGVVQQLSQANPDATYQANLRSAKTSSFLVIDAMANAATTTQTTYDQLVHNYDSMIGDVEAVLAVQLPLPLRTAAFDEVCATSASKPLKDLYDQCFDEGERCELALDLFDTINDCTDYKNGAAIADLITRLGTTHAGLVAKRGVLASERDAIQTLWAAIQGHR
jgi:hypothetical protein